MLMTEVLFHLNDPGDDIRSALMATALGIMFGISFDYLIAIVHICISVCPEN